MTTPETMSHDQAIELLPWLVNESLASGECDALREHAASCVICRRELAQLEALQESIAADAGRLHVPAPDMRPINARIDALLVRENRGRKLLASLRDWYANPWRLAVAVQAVAIAVLLAAWLLPRAPGEPEFRTLSTPQLLPAGHYLRVVFDPTLDATAVSALLDRRRLSVVGGPSERGVYTLRFAEHVPAAEREAVTANLVDEPGVLFAQPVTGSSK